MTNTIQHFSAGLFPRVLHFFWESAFKSGDNFPDDVSSTIEAWSCTHPGYVRKVWSLYDVIELAQRSGYCNVVDAITKCRLVAMKSDIARALILLCEGGVYSDLKNYPNQYFLERYTTLDSLVLVKYPPGIFGLNDDNSIFNGFIICPPGHQMLHTLTTRICENVISEQRGSPFDITGSGVLTQVVGSLPVGQAVILPPEEVWEGTNGLVRPLKRVKASYNGPGEALHWTHAKTDNLYF